MGVCMFVLTQPSRLTRCVRLMLPLSVHEIVWNELGMVRLLSTGDGLMC